MIYGSTKKNPPSPSSPSSPSYEVGDWTKSQIDSLLNQISWAYAKANNIKLEEFQDFSIDFNESEDLARALDGAYQYSSPKPLSEFAQKEMALTPDYLAALERLGKKGYTAGIIPVRIKQNPLGLPSIFVETPKEFWEIDPYNYEIATKEITSLLQDFRVASLPLQVIPENNIVVNATLPQIKSLLDASGVQYTIIENGSNSGLGE